MMEPPISLHYQHIEEWLNDRRAVLQRKHKKQFSTLLQLAPKLVQLVQYDVPALQKQVAKCNSTIEECHRVCEDADRVVQNGVARRERMLESHGLTADIAEQSAEMVSSAIDARIDQGTTTLNRALCTFANEHLENFRAVYEDIVIASAPELFSSGVFGTHFPWFSRLLAECMLPIDAGSLAKEGADGMESEAPQIDWGDDGDVFGTASSAPVVEIKWDSVEDTVQAKDDDNGNLPATSGVTLSLDISRVHDRQHILAELKAVQCFATERGISAGDSSLHLLVSACEKAVSHLCESDDAEFMRMKANPRGKAVFEDGLNQFTRSIAAANTRRVNHEALAQKAIGDLQLLEPQINTVIQETRTTRDACLEQLSTMFPNRKILITGDIAKIL